MTPFASVFIAAAALFLTISANHDSYDRWTLTGYDFNQSSFAIQPYVSNGYIGQRLPVAGFGYSAIEPLGPQNGTNGWPLFDNRFTAAMVAGFYDQQPNTTGTNFQQTGGQQPISTIPTWSSVYLTVDGVTLLPDVSPDLISNFSQSMSIQDGVVETSFHWKPGSTAPQSVHVKYTTFAHRSRPNLGVVRLEVGNLNGRQVSLTDILDGQGAHRTTPQSAGPLDETESPRGAIYTAVNPDGIDNVTCYEISALQFRRGNGTLSNSKGACYEVPADPATASQCYTVEPSSGAFSVVKFVGIASSDAFPQEEQETALKAVTCAQQDGYDQLLKEHQQAWAATWDESDIIIPGQDKSELQYAARASLFHILTNLRKGSEPHGLGDTSIAPAGLTSDSYAGQIFWDADTWMFYPLLSLFPEYAENINNYRLRYLPAAQTNAAQYNLSGALYPWTGGRFGNCTGVGPCYDYEYHLNNDIALAHIDYFYVTQNLTWLTTKGFPVIGEVAEMWPSLVDYNKSTNDFDINNATDPDEYANFQDNPAFTNAGIITILKEATKLGRDWLGYDVPDDWQYIADRMALLAAPSGIILEYDGFNGTVEVKQADVVLLTWPLEYPLDRQTALKNFAYYAERTSADGPGMTYSVFSIGIDELAPYGCAGYTYMLAASQPYSREPFYQFSEQTNDVYNENGGTNPAFTFLTGHGGFLQTFTNGFTGFRPRLDAFYLDPSLPPQLPELIMKGMHWKDSLFDVTIKLDSTTVTRRSGSESNAKVLIGGQRNRKSGNYNLAVGESITVPTYITNGLLIPGNAAQCQSISDVNDTSFTKSSKQAIIAGQYGFAAIDGNNATVCAFLGSGMTYILAKTVVKKTWQPVANGTSELTIQLEEPTHVSHIHLNFGERPARTFSLSAGPDAASLQPIVSNVAVNLSAPAGSFDPTVVDTRIGNTTDAYFTTVQAALFRLSVEGCYEPDGVGPTVAEVALLP